MAFLLLTLVGTQPLAGVGHGGKSEGDSLHRNLVLVLLFLSMLVLWNRRGEAAACIRRNRLLFAVVFLCQLSVLWSAFPVYTLKRALLLLFLTSIATAIAVGSTNLRKLHTTLFVVMTGVVALNISAAVLWPEYSFYEIGFRGICMDKNTAGMLAMLTTIIGATWIVGASSSRARLVGLGSLSLALFLVILTRSKTSIALTFLALLIGFVLMIVKHTGPRSMIILIATSLAAMAAILAVLGWSDFHVSWAVSRLAGDASFSGRDELWAFALKSGSEKPWLGYGYGAFWDVGDDHDRIARLEPGTWLGDVDPKLINQAHNGYLELWLNMGLPTTALAVASVLAAIATATGRAMQAYTGSSNATIFAAIALILFLYLVHNMMEATLFNRGLPFCNLAILMALLAGRPSDRTRAGA